MSDLTGRDRRYDEEEVARILRDSAELQAMDASGAAVGALSLQELQRIAAEVGIEPRFVTDAALRRTRSPGGVWTRLLGPFSRFHQERTVQGEVGGADWSRLVDEMRSETRHEGETAHLPGRLEWRGRHEWSGEEIRLRVESADGSTRVEMEAEQVLASTAAVLAAGTCGLLAAAAVVGPIGADMGMELATLGLGGAGGALLGRAAWKRRALRWHRRLERLTGRIAASIEDTRGRAPGTPLHPELSP